MFDCSAGHNVKSEPTVDWVTEQEKDTDNHFNLAQPDALLASYWLGQNLGCVKEQAVSSDKPAMLPGDGFSKDHKYSTSNQVRDLDRISCSNMAAAAQMYNLH